MKDGMTEKKRKLSQVVKNNSAKHVFIGCFLHAVYTCEVKK